MSGRQGVNQAPPNHEKNMNTFERACRNARTDIEILIGNEVGPNDASWQDVAGTLATNLAVISDRLHKIRAGASSEDLHHLSQIISE